MSGWGREERRQSDVSAYSRAERKRNIKRDMQCVSGCCMLVRQWAPLNVGVGSYLYVHE